ncbi:MAG: hypothetical protein HYT27_03510 [Parcubacteria group bacterium]|nr:hypothetical protein [Parcubacteria group bacterium]
MQNKIILGIVLLLAVVVGGLFFFNKNAAAPVVELEEGTLQDNSLAVPAPGFENIVDEMMVVENPVSTVTYTENGFAPLSVEIKKGEAVIFKNESGASLWVASAIHPTHSLYPQKSPSDCLGSSFDACAVTAPGSSWNFTFTEVGSWNYHNHIQANHRGTIVVK